MLPVPTKPTGDSTSAVTRFSDAARAGILLLGCCFVGACVVALVFAKRLAANVRSRPEAFHEHRTAGTRNGNKVKSVASKTIIEEHPEVTREYIENIPYN